MPEVWAVGNVALVLHRKSGQNKWEQLTVTAKQEADSSPPANPTLTRSITPPSLTASVFVPSLLGLTLQEAQKEAFASGLKLDIAYEGGRTGGPAFVFLPTTTMRVPHPCVLCKGGNHEPIP